MGTIIITKKRSWKTRWNTNRKWILAIYILECYGSLWAFIFKDRSFAAFVFCPVASVSLLSKVLPRIDHSFISQIHMLLNSQIVEIYKKYVHAFNTIVFNIPIPLRVIGNGHNKQIDMQMKRRNGLMHILTLSN